MSSFRDGIEAAASLIERALAADSIARAAEIGGQ